MSFAGVQAATYCVGPNATGNGSGADWSNQKAWSSSFTRGDTWYLRGGTGYGNVAMTSANSGTTRNTIKKATAADHVTETGWSAAYGTDPAVCGKFEVNASNSDYWTVDGQGGNYYTSTTYGIKFSNTAIGDETVNFLAGGAGTIFRYVEIAGPGGTGDFSYTADTGGLASWGGQAENTLIQYCYIHGASTLVSWSDPGLIIEYSVLKDSKSNNGAAHSNVYYCGFQANDITFRYNKVSNFNDEGFFITWYSSASSPPQNIKIYGNTFYSPGTTNPRGIEIRQFDGSGSGQVYRNILVYNNTFIELAVGGFLNRATEGGLGSSTGCALVNNISRNAGYLVGDTATVANNLDGVAATVFVNVGAENFHLSAATAAGTTLSSPYNADMDGVTRGANGTWDIGAFEYGGSTTNPVVSVSPVSLDFGSVLTNSSRDLILTVRNTGAGTLGGSASVGAPFSVTSGGTYSLGANQSQTVTVRFSPTAVGSTNRTVTFTGGGGTTATVSGAGASGNLPPTVSAIIQNATDVDPVVSGFQVLEGTAVQYSGSASDPNGDPLTWQWIYTVDGGPEVVHQTGAGTVSPVNFVYAAGTGGRTYVWKLRVSDGQTSAEAQSTIGVQVLPPTLSGLSFEAEAGTVTAPFIIANGSVYQTEETSVTAGGRVTYAITITNAGDYAIQATVNAPNEAANSVFVNFDAEPEDPGMIWQIPVTTGFESRIVNAQGTGTFDNPQFVPKFFTLAVGPHQLIIRGREANTQLDSLKLLKRVAPPRNLLSGPGP